MKAAERWRKQEGLKVTHDWRPIRANAEEFATAPYYTARHRRYWCPVCGAISQETYVSHRHGWQRPMKWFSRCKPPAPAALPSRTRYYGARRLARIAQETFLEQCAAAAAQTYQDQQRIEAERVTLELASPLRAEQLGAKPSTDEQPGLFGPRQERF